MNFRDTIPIRPATNQVLFPRNNSRQDNTHNRVAVISVDFFFHIASISIPKVVIEPQR